MKGLMGGDHRCLIVPDFIIELTAEKVLPAIMRGPDQARQPASAPQAQAPATGQK